MKKIKTVLLSACTLIFLFACNTNIEQNAEEHHEHAHHERHEHHHHTETSEVIELNDGEKWLINQEMQPFLDKEQNLISEYIQNASDDYLTLAEQLEVENNNLIKSCTMKGQSHDELHKWLHPHMELIAQLKSAGDEHEAEELISKLQSSFSIFNEYFQ